MKENTISTAELKVYEIAFMLCNDEIKEANSESIDIVIENKINEIVLMFQSKITNPESLRNYLNKRISKDRFF